MLGLMSRIQADPNLTLQVVASDMHLNATFGSTLNEVSERVAVDAVVDLGDYGSNEIDRTQALGRCISEFAPVIDRLNPDIIVLLGDRGETLAAAFCAVEMGVVIAHIQAGDISGGIDDIHRHSITKLSHLHFSQNESQRQRVISLGEREDRVWNSGAPYIDNILASQFVPTKDALIKLNLPPDGPFIIVLQHPDTYRPEDSFAHTEAILSAMKDRPENKIVVYPCSDPGYDGVIDAIRHIEDTPRFHVFRNIEAMTFLGLLHGAIALVGNSSGGIIEAPYCRLPFILVGARQDGRQMANNVIKVDAPHPEKILSALEHSQSDDFQTGMANDSQPFGDGNACERIFNVLRNVEITPELFRKRITY